MFADTKMLKIDTDGFDCAIIMSERDLLADKKPVVFFEYDPYFFENLSISGFHVFQHLRDIGYQFAIVYDNTGDYLLSTDLSNVELLQDIHTYFSGRGGMRYCDICVFHSEDSDLAEKVDNSEKTFARKTREGVLTPVTPGL
jgi:hypothetical protein